MSWVDGDYVQMIDGEMQEECLARGCIQGINSRNIDSQELTFND
jgi:hypothetical protein